MNTVIRREGNISKFIGWMLVVMAGLVFITLIVIAIVGDPVALFFLFGPVILLIGAWVNFHMGSRARLEITPDEFVWCGFTGRARRIAWRDLDRILIPASGLRPRLAAAARLRDGRIIEVEALWISPTNPANILSPPDHTEAQRALIDGHKAYLANSSRQQSLLKTLSLNTNSAHSARRR
ncbi:hypothetical protein [Brevibacterium spongiae]|uniref:PH domain-containing protein n=1 Tax=Brevibacterium spongiae TaxID=2909672 RepID=A0ABY5SK29_9MICO|nr:hypothetical protein [Brevibacterium spongiae]UVI34887.1 hypothetical protein L1F31_12220 [Brevibacterium spongiae]